MRAVLALVLMLLPTVSAAQACTDPVPALTTDPVTIAVDGFAQSPTLSYTVAIFRDGSSTPVASTAVPVSAWTRDTGSAGCYVAPVPATWKAFGAGPYRAALRVGTVWSAPSNLLAWSLQALPAPSPDCTSGPSVVDASGRIWTLSNTDTLRDGVWMASGRGTQYLWAAQTVYVLGTDVNWWKFTGTTWALVGPAKPACTLPVPAPPPGPVITSVCLTDPLKLTVTRWPAQATGARTLTYNTNKPSLVALDVRTRPWTVTATDARACVAQVQQ